MMENKKMNDEMLDKVAGGAGLPSAVYMFLKTSDASIDIIYAWIQANQATIKAAVENCKNIEDFKALLTNYKDNETGAVKSALEEFIGNSGDIKAAWNNKGLLGL